MNASTSFYDILIDSTGTCDVKRQKIINKSKLFIALVGVKEDKKK